MKSSYPSFPPARRALIVSAVLLTSGALCAQSYSGSSSSSSSTAGRNTSSYSGTSNNSDMSSSSTASTSGNDMSSSTSSSSGKLSWTDRRFVTKAADDGQQEVQIAQLAAQKASNPDVRQFAQQMVDQHTQVNTQLMSLASSKNVKIDQDDATKDRTYKRLSKASGNDFDREFVDHMVDEHEKDIKMFEKAANNAKDPEVRQFASNTLEHLRQHLTQVQQLQQSIVPTGRTDSNSWRSSGSSSNTSSSGTPSSGMNGSTSGSTSGASSTSTSSMP